MASVDVCVVGGGLSGLACAYQLLQLNGALKVVVLEARERVGGRTWTVECAGGLVDVGGQWIGVTQPRVTALAAALGLELVEQAWLGGDAAVQATHDARASFVAEMPVQAGPIPLTDAEAAEVLGVIEQIDALARTVPLAAPWACARAAEWDALSVDDFFKACAPSPVALRELRLAVQTILASEPRDLSLLYFLFFVRAADGFRHLSDGPGGAQHYKVATGMQSLSTRLAAVLRERGTEIVLNAAVRAIRNGALEEARGPTAVFVDRRDGGPTQYAARRVVVAMPPPVAAAIDIFPGCERRQLLGKAMHMGACIKTICVYKKAFWHAAGAAGGQRALDLHYSELGPVSNIFDATVGGQPALVGLVVGDTARVWSSRVNSALFRSVILQQYARIFASKRALSPVHFVAKSWLEEPLSKGCYAAVMGVGVMTSYGEALFAPVGAIHWAGTEASTSWNGYFEGAVQAGQREAEAIVASLRQEDLLKAKL